MIDEQDILVIGSQAILGSYNDAGLPADVTLSIEADLGSFDDPDERKADQIDGALGELSAFHESFGIYGDGVTAATAVLPAGWRDRLVPLTESSGSGAIGWCIDVHDLCAAKLYAGPPKDFRFVEAALRHRLVDVIELRARISALAGESARIDNATNWLVSRDPTPMSESLRSRWWRARREALRHRMQVAPRPRPNST